VNRNLRSKSQSLSVHGKGDVGAWGVNDSLFGHTRRVASFEGVVVREGGTGGEQEQEKRRRERIQNLEKLVTKAAGIGLPRLPTARNEGGEARKRKGKEYEWDLSVGPTKGHARIGGRVLFWRSSLLRRRKSCSLR